MTTGNINRVVRQSPSGRRLGVMGFARLSLSAPAAYADSVDLQIPFDRIDDMSAGFGALTPAGGALSAPGAFRLSESGIYLVQTLVGYDTFGTGFGLDIILGASDLIALVSRADNLPLAISAVGNGIIGDVTPAPAADVSVVVASVGAAGLVTVATCLILQVG
jgi:hypothetical protein